MHSSFHVLNPFLANVPVLYPLKALENLWFFGVFRGYKMGTLARNGLSFTKYLHYFYLNDYLNRIFSYADIF